MSKKMSGWIKNPCIYEINTRLWLKELSVKYGRGINLATVPTEVLSSISSLGFDAVWLMGVWKPSVTGREIAAEHDGLRGEFFRTLPDLQEGDILASPYAVAGYEVSESLGGNDALAVFRKLAADCGLKLILDFVPNHTAMDHPWIKEHPEYYVGGTTEDLRNDPANFFNSGTDKNPVVIAHGKDPYFPGWTDTAQLNYFDKGLRKAQIEQIMALASMCDGIRCDMAMLLLNEIHLQVWGRRLFTGQGLDVPGEFWSEAIPQVKKKYAGFLFIAEAYWMKEGPLQLLGFDYTYDKALYDWLKSAETSAISHYLSESPDYQKRCVRFIENHDEERAAAVFGSEHHKTAALIMATLPGARLLHEGQLEGAKVRCPVQLGRRRVEPIDKDLYAFYGKLLQITSSAVFHEGLWTKLEPVVAWENNFLHDNFLIWIWSFNKEVYLAVANLSPVRSQCYVRLPEYCIQSGGRVLEDLLDDNVYERDGDELCSKGLYLDIDAWYRHLFRIS